MKKVFLALMLAASPVALVACGDEDPVEDAVDEVEDAADDVADEVE